jgi:uncharacterized protein (DUF488 family)
VSGHAEDDPERHRTDDPGDEALAHPVGSGDDDGDGRSGQPQGSAVNAIRTLGHGTLSADELASLFTEAGIEVVVDVRRYPGSRRHPHFGRDQMAAWLPGTGSEYRWMPALGGRRRPEPGSPNLGLRNEQFRAYADHMATAEFADAVTELVRLATDRSVAVMCSESVWWRCHRRLLADHLVLVVGAPVDHLFHDGRLVEHPPTPEARRAGGHLVYDLEAERPLFGE